MMYNVMLCGFLRMTEFIEEQEQEQEQEQHYPGTPLIEALIEKAEERGLDRYGLAEALGMTYSYLTHILNGKRAITGINISRLREISEFLEITLVQVMMLAEIIQPEDFIMQDQLALKQQLESVYRALIHDPDWRGMTPSRDVWNASDDRMKILLGMIYQRLTQQDLREFLVEVVPIIELNQEG